MNENVLLNKKFVIGLNQKIGESGELQSPSSLDYAISTMKHKKSWLYELSYIIRSLLIDHAFRDGNKRTALALILIYFEHRDVVFDREKVVVTMHKIAKNNVNNVNNIVRLIQSVIIK